MASNSEISLNMDIFPSKNEQISACEKLRDTVTGISVLHQIVQDDARFHTHSPMNSFMHLYRMNTEAMMRKKEDLVNELRTLPFPALETIAKSIRSPYCCS
ncbi:hypothetical protein TNCV_5050291 [Trichonephila clavipes]|nr:hypothetical protein TNCV_5050291 [Trichonephila clavipes]